tara:strand:+ start:256 stop:528 length:273 start_codon:yes stop_codon:yes gene_type:complete
MDNTYTLNGNIIVELGGMQITREQLDAFKSSRVCKVNSDQEAVDYLINIAERAFEQAVQAAEYIADLQEGGDPYEIQTDEEWYKENCHML